MKIQGITFLKSLKHFTRIPLPKKSASQIFTKMNMTFHLKLLILQQRGNNIYYIGLHRIYFTHIYDDSCNHIYDLLIQNWSLMHWGFTLHSLTNLSSLPFRFLQNFMKSFSIFPVSFLSSSCSVFSNLSMTVTQTEKKVK